LALAAGAAYYEKNSTNSPRQIFTILGDQECNEGSVWEAALLTSTLKLGNVVTLIDMNGSDSRSIPMANLADKWRSFNWKVIEVDGHDIGNLEFAIDQTKDHPDSPSALICKTVKGKGVSFMESSFEWHHKKLDQLSLTKALEELQDA
jgi:transketolase